jgi:hypothetical protein
MYCHNITANSLGVSSYHHNNPEIEFGGFQIKEKD